MINYYNANQNLVLLIKLIDIKANKLKGAESINPLPVVSIITFISSVLIIL